MHSCVHTWIRQRPQVSYRSDGSGEDSDHNYNHHQNQMLQLLTHISHLTLIVASGLNFLIYRQVHWYLLIICDRKQSVQSINIIKLGKCQMGYQKGKDVNCDNFATPIILIQIYLPYLQHFPCLDILQKLSIETCSFVGQTFRREFKRLLVRWKCLTRFKTFDIIKFTINF